MHLISPSKSTVPIEFNLTALTQHSYLLRKFSYISCLRLAPPLPRAPQFHVKQTFNKKDTGFFFFYVTFQGQCPVAAKPPWTLSPLHSVFGVSGP